VSNQPWLIARAAGLVAWVLLMVTMFLGVAVRSPRPSRPAGAWYVDLHRFAATLSVVFVGLHLYGIVADSFVDFTLADVLVPFASAWNPAAVAWGVVALYLLTAVHLSSLLWRRLSRTAWKAIHFASYPLAVTATVHAATSGTDVGAPVVMVVGIAVCAVVGAGASVRAIHALRGRQPRPATARRLNR
jgi:predicted ferric reductase